MLTIRAFQRFFSLLFAVVLCLCGTIDCFAQGCGEPTKPSFGWAAGSVINVNINTSGMTTDQQDAIVDAFNSWSGTGKGYLPNNHL